MGKREEEIRDLVDAIDDAKPEIEGDEPTPEPKRKKAKAYLITDEMVEEEFDRIDRLNFLALAQYKKETKQQITDLEDTKTMIETLQKLMQKGDFEGLGQSIMAENLKSEIDLATQEEMDEFLANFDQNLANLNRTIDYITEREEIAKDIPKTSTYMNQCMLEVLDQKTASFRDDTSKRTKPIRIFYRNICEVYQHRDSMEFLKSQVKPNITYVRRILNDLKKQEKNGKSGDVLTKAIMQNVQNTFCSVFKLEQMQVFEHHLKGMIGGRAENPQLISFLFQYLLYIIYINEKSRKKGRHKWVEAMIMNILDIESGNYDLPKPSEDLEQEIFEMISGMVYELHL